MSCLTKDAILGADDLPRERVTVPEWGGDVFVRTMKACERDAFELWYQSLGKNVRNVRAALAVRTVVDDQGQRLFEDGDVEALGQKSASALDAVFAVAQRVNKLTPADVDDLEKN